MTQLKYVRHSALGFVLWPMTDTLWHAHVGAMLRRAPGEIISAGFTCVEGGVVVCCGKSESLGISSRPDDAEALAKQLGLTTKREGL